MDRVRMIQELSDSFGAPGFEDDVLGIIRKYKGGLSYTQDKLMNVYLGLEGVDPAKKTVMLDAHTDEVGFMVQSIDDKGLIRFVPLGGWIPHNVPAHLVAIRNREGLYVKGVTSSVPPHFMSPAQREKKIELADIMIDVGASSREEVVNDFKIDIAAPIVPSVDFEYNSLNDIMRGKAFDNRLGCAAILAVMDMIDRDKLAVNLVGAFAAQEEVGMRGAELTARRVQPALAITFEGSPADDTCTDPSLVQGALNKGPQLRHRDSGYISNHRLNRYAQDIAAREGIEIQNAVRRAGSTNAAKIHLATEGVPTLVLGIASRYAHTHYGFASFRDFEKTVELAALVIGQLDGNSIDSF